MEADAETAARLEPHRTWLAGETLAQLLDIGPAAAEGSEQTESLELDGVSLRLGVRRAAR